ncbi:MAG: hypothetical protein AB1461_01130 [Thermodesulfobacteriota bacterium]
MNKKTLIIPHLSFIIVFSSSWILKFWHWQRELRQARLLPFKENDE